MHAKKCVSQAQAVRVNFNFLVAAQYIHRALPGESGFISVKVGLVVDILGDVGLGEV